MAFHSPPETCPPELAELSRALSSLSQDKVRYMCVELGVPSATLSNIDASHPREALRCITGYLEALLAHDVSLTWERIVDVLSSSRLREHTLATAIRKAHCLSVVDGAGDRPTTPPPSRPFVRSSSGVNSGTRKGGYTPPTCSVDESLPQPHAIDVRQLGDKIKDIKRKFRHVVINVKVHLSDKISQNGLLKSFKADLTTLPMGETHEILLQKEKERIQEAQSVQKVFDILDPYWNHVDYELLEYIVQEYCDKEIKKQMENYKSELHKFEKATPVEHLTSAANFHPLPPDYSTLTVTLMKDAKECSLYDVRQMKNSIAQRANLKPYVMLFRSVHVKSVVLTIGFPHAVSELIRRALDSEFLSEVGIVPSSLKFSDSPPPTVPSLTDEQEKSIPGD